MAWLLEPWPWWLSGILIGLMVPLLFWMAGQPFGISSSLQHIGAMCSPRSRLAYLREDDWRGNLWNLLFVAGVVIGGFVAVHFLSRESIEFLPQAYYSPTGLLRLAFGGVLVGFGTRYAGGCTSGHSITGLSNLSGASLLATVFFFVGGLIVTWLLGSVLLPA